MDRGAARSRKREQKPSQASRMDEKITRRPVAAGASSEITTNSTPGPSRLPRKSHISKQRAPREPQSRDPALYKAKAVRSAAALIYSEAAFPLPPPKDILKGVRRIDLAGSNVKDIDWLKECHEVTWLNLAGCEDVRGWEGVGGLSNLSGKLVFPLLHSVGHSSHRIGQF